MIPETKTIRLPQGEITYLASPAIAEGQHPPLVVLHTSGGPLWTPLLALLAAERQVLMPVLPGYGGTPLLDGVASVPDLADLAAAFIAAVAGDPVDIFGGSFGGWIALYLAARHPALVTDMVLEAPAGVAVGADPAAQDPEAPRKGLFAHPDKAKGLLPGPEILASQGAAFRHYGGPMLVDEALLPLLPQITAHVLVVMGTLDRVTPPEAGRFLARALTHCNLSYVYDAAHAVQVDQAEAMFKVVRHFLDKGPAFIVASRDYA